MKSGGCGLRAAAGELLRVFLMGRELRRVTADWQHPKNDRGEWIPLYEWFPMDAEGVVDGMRANQLDPLKPQYGVPLMPRWPFSERTHIQYYEVSTEGTPISPVCATVEELAAWCHEHAPRTSGMSHESGLMGGLTLEDWDAYLQGEFLLWYRRARVYAPYQHLSEPSVLLGKR